MHLMSRAEFEAFARDPRNVRIVVRPPFEIVPCGCGDLNCHGWRFVERSGENWFGSGIAAGTAAAPVAGCSGPIQPTEIAR